MPSEFELRSEYYELLKQTVVLVDRSDRYDRICEEYKALCKRINKLLEDMDAFCVDAERYIDKSTGGLRANIGFEPDPVLAKLFGELCGLYTEKQHFATEYGWDDDLLNHIEAVLAIAAYEDMEKRIIAELGADAGERVIYETKKEIVAFERELGVVFFSQAVERMEALFRTRVLFSPEGEIVLTDKDCLCEQSVTLVNKHGERLAFTKWAQIAHRGEIYIELELLEDMKIGKFHYYRLAQAQGGWMLTLVEDGPTESELDGKRDRLTV